MCRRRVFRDAARVPRPRSPQEVMFGSWQARCGACMGINWVSGDKSVGCYEVKLGLTGCLFSIFSQSPDNPLHQQYTRSIQAGAQGQMRAREQTPAEIKTAVLWKDRKWLSQRNLTRERRLKRSNRLRLWHKRQRQIGRSRSRFQQRAATH